MAVKSAAEQPSGAEQLKITGRVRVEIRNAKTSVVLRAFERDNLIVNAGKNLTAQRLASNGPAAIGWCAVGTSNTAANANDTTLGAEVARVALDNPSYPGTGQVRWVNTFGATVGNGSTWKEIAWFNASSAGTMLNHLILTGAEQVSKTSAILVNVTLTLTVS